ncbi:hypothetical protein [Mycolicibacterium sp. J2]|uniref:hypothetical protein n=1 Tax=Mycolicibacterium sp. J2 TaxID=2993511 RepID=UPI00224A8126|nr:hypothetical protein [Mycolicibacterium sp. J2]MCX2710791.1 hypothetical protein [Mycolicibacterium sp. J2]
MQDHRQDVEQAGPRELGRPVHRVALPKIEGGERDITVQELVGLAAALDISPLTLLVPNVLAEVEILPGVEVQGVDVLGWWTGAGGLTDIPARDLFPKDEGIRLASELVGVEKALRLQRANLEQAERAHLMCEKGADRERVDQIRARIGALEAHRDGLIDDYRSAADRSSPDA